MAYNKAAMVPGNAANITEAMCIIPRCVEVCGAGHLVPLRSAGVVIPKYIRYATKYKQL